MKLSQFYEKLDNPIYDDETLEKIVDIYSESSNFMEDVLKINSESDCSFLSSCLSSLSLGLAPIAS